MDTLAADADLLLCEANDPVANPFHHTPEQAGALARRTSARRLAVTHVGPLLTLATATTRASEVFDGPTTYAEVGTTLII